MSEEALPGEVRRFLLHAIDSVPHLEALLLMRENAGSRWTPHSLAERLFLPEERAAGILDALVRRELAAQVEGGFVFAPRREATRLAIERLAECYRTHLVMVSGLLHAKAEQPERAFSEAFRFRKEK